MQLNTFLQNIVRARKLVALCLEKAGVPLKESAVMNGDRANGSTRCWRWPPARSARATRPGGSCRQPPGSICLPRNGQRLFDLQAESRLLERALDPDGLSGTGRAVVARIRGMGQLG